jgi:hypothetical protein
MVNIAEHGIQKGTDVLEKTTGEVFEVETNPAMKVLRQLV